MRNSPRNALIASFIGSVIERLSSPKKSCHPKQSAYLNEPSFCSKLLDIATKSSLRWRQQHRQNTVLNISRRSKNASVSRVRRLRHSTIDMKAMKTTSLSLKSLNIKHVTLPIHFNRTTANFNAFSSNCNQFYNQGIRMLRERRLT